MRSLTFQIPVVVECTNVRVRATVDFLIPVVDLLEMLVLSYCRMERCVSVFSFLLPFLCLCGDYLFTSIAICHEDCLQ